MKEIVRNYIEVFIFVFHIPFPLKQIKINPFLLKLNFEGGNGTQ